MPEKGIAEAIEVARQTGIRLVIAAKVKHPDEHALFEAVVQPAIDDGVVDWRGEIGAGERDALMAGALATLMLGAWPEPFGLVAIESMATGTPVIGRRAGALVETVRHGITGYLVDDVREAVLAVSRVGALDRRPIATYARSRFSVERMVDEHERVYATLADGRPSALARHSQPSMRRATPVASTMRSRRARPYPQPLPGRDGRAAGPAPSDGAAAPDPISASLRSRPRTITTSSAGVRPWLEHHERDDDGEAQELEPRDEEDPAQQRACRGRGRAFRLEQLGDLLRPRSDEEPRRR